MALVHLLLPLVLAGASVSERPSPRETHFGSGWADAGQAPIPDVPPVPEPPADSPPEDGGEVGDEHNPGVHMAITRRAYAYYASRYSGGELAYYIGDGSGGKPPPGRNTVVAGAYEEDMPFQNPWNEAISQLRHFWDFRKGDQDGGMMGFDTSVNRSHKYWTGGYGLDGTYDRRWSASLGKLKRRC